MSRIDINNLTKKQRRQIHSWLRAIIQLLYFLFLPSAYTAAFAGVKYIFTQLGAGEKIGLTSFVSVLIVLCLYTIVFGRFFCGFACAFGSFGDAVHALYIWGCRKLKKKPVKLPEKITEKLTMLKYIVLAVIAVLCFKGVYSQTQGYSPWDVFSMLHAFNFKLDGYVLGVVLLVLIMICMALQERFFCRFLCPMGAVFSWLPILPFFTLRREREQCIKGCSACTKQCPSDIGLPEAGSLDVSGDCFQCQKCIDTCPRVNIHCGLSGIKGSGVIFTIIRALILLGLFIWLGI